MLKSYFRIAWRNIKKHRYFSLLNIIGLSSGLACAIFIYLWVHDEMSIDKFHRDDARLYQAMSHIKLPDGIHTQENTPVMLPAAIEQSFPEVEKAVGVDESMGSGNIFIKEKKFRAEAWYTTADLFTVFSYQLLGGDQAHLFPDKYHVVLSSDLAMKLFHSTDVIGQTIHWEQDVQPYTVSGIFKRPGANSSASCDILFAYDLLYQRNPDLVDWQNSSPNTYVIVKPGTDVSALSKKLEHFLQLQSKFSPLSLSLVKYSDKYLHENFENGVQAGGRIAFVKLFSVIAIFILILACINFMNLSTARAATRLKEVGIKKAAGASRAALITQYLAESLMLCFFAILISLLIVAFLLPEFNHITGKQLSIPFEGTFIFVIVCIWIITGAIAGFYPALYMSGFAPADVLKGSLKASIGELWVRKGLVVFQYSLSIIFLIGVLVIYRQGRLIQTIDLGYNKSQVISLERSASIRTHFTAFESGLKAIPGVSETASMRGNFTGSTAGSTERVNWQGKLPDASVMFYAFEFDDQVSQLMGIKMLQGRSFSKDFGGDSLGMLLNAAAVRAMGLTDPVGKTVSVWGGVYHILGVTSDFHYKSLYDPVKPCFIRYSPKSDNILVRLSTINQHETISGINKLWKQYNPGEDFNFTFLDQQYNAMYRSEERVAVLSRYFAGMAVIISSLGLIGLAAFSAQKRKKELGIRKIIGASVSGLVSLLTFDFVKLLFIAMIIAFPLSWWMMNEWLNNFAYHIKISPVIFIFSGGMVMLLTFLSIGFQSFKAAVSNPVESLRP